MTLKYDNVSFPVGKRSSFSAVTAALLALFSVTGSAYAAESLDPSFGLGGISISPIGSKGELDAVARDKPGRLVTAGTTASRGFIVQRFLSDGSLDTSFGKNGEALTMFSRDASANTVAVQPDGRIIVAGGQQKSTGSAISFALSRYLPDGKPDLSFGKRGRVVVAGPTVHGGEASALAIQPDGRILAAGYAADTLGSIFFGHIGILMRFKPNGELDESFSHDGVIRLDAGLLSLAKLTSVVVLPGGKILAAGQFGGRVALLRANPDGSPDRSFARDGLVLTDFGPGRCKCASARGIEVLPDGRIVVGVNVEWSPRYVALARYRAHGTLDRSFGHGGVVNNRHLDASEGVAVSRDGRIVMAGYRWPKHGRPQVAVLRYLPDGKPDSSFAENGFFSERLAYESIAKGVLVEPEGGAVVVGRSNPRQAPTRGIEGEPGRSSVLDLGEFMLMRFLP